MAEFTLADAQNGARLTVRVGDTIIIRLAEGAAAGYRWMLASLDETRITVTRQSFQPAGAAVGSAGTAVWTLRATQAGTTRVELKKSRPWQSGDSAERFAVGLEVVS